MLSSGPRSPFELEMLGGAVEKRYRRQRPGVDAIPWEALDARALPAPLRERARRFWSQTILSEHRAAASAAAVAQALVAARAPIDLCAMAAQFVVDELSHVELAARVVTALGGAVPLWVDDAVPRPRAKRGALAHALSEVVRVFCVNEAFSLAMARVPGRGDWHPTIAAVVARIRKDEAAHGRFGWIVLDWAAPKIDPRTRAHLRRVAREAIASLEELCAGVPPAGERTLGWVPASRFAADVAHAIEHDLRAPLRARGLQ